jgi:hypothetical protein
MPKLFNLSGKQKAHLYMAFCEFTLAQTKDAAAQKLHMKMCNVKLLNAGLPIISDLRDAVAKVILEVEELDNGD